MGNTFPSRGKPIFSRADAGGYIQATADYGGSLATGKPYGTR